jgi:hypothetical protein
MRTDRWPDPSMAGVVAWLAGMVLLPAPLAARIFLLAPLVIVPRLIRILPARPWIGGLGGWTALLAALPLIGSFALTPGPLAAALVVPWLALALVGAAAAVRHGLANLPSILHPSRLPDLGIDVALGLWGAGAVFLVTNRLGLDIGFVPVIVLLTATHFHFAGFGLLALASVMAASRPWLRVPVGGLIVGIPFTALGFVLVSDPISAIGAVVVGASGLGVGIALVTSRVTDRIDWLARVAGVALLIGMPMGIAWSLAILTGAPFLDLETMVRTHGVLNSLAVVLGVMAYRVG